jgi:hypothetical protein
MKKYLLVFFYVLVQGQESNFLGKWQLEAKVSFDLVNSNLLF